MQRKNLDRAAKIYHQSLNEQALTYLESRGLNDEDLLNEYRLGLVTNPEAGHEDMVGRLCIPYQTPSGVVALRFRCIGLHDCKELAHAKYLDLPGQQSRLYNVQALQDAGSTIYVTEGELDAITATEVGYPAVGVAGATKWEPHWGRLLEDFEEVLVLADGDESGRKFGKLVRSSVESARVVHMPDGEDVNSFIMKHDDTTEFEKLVS